MEHEAYTIGGKGGSGYAVATVLVGWLAVTLSHIYCHLARLTGYQLATELLLKVTAVFNLSTQTGRLAFMVEIGSIDGVAIGIEGYVAPDGECSMYS